jgi:hypothetical protein
MSFILSEKVFTATATAEALSATSKRVASVYIQVKRANSNAAQIGFGTFTTGKGIELCKPTADEKLSDFPLRSIVPGGNNIDLADIYVMGTSGEGVNFYYEEY